MRYSSIIAQMLITTFGYVAAQDSSFCVDSGPGEYVDYGGGRTITTLTGARINIYLHIVREDDGSGGLTDDQINTSLQHLSTDFSPFNISFLETGREYINSSEYYNISKFNTSLICQLMTEFSTEHNIDIFFVSTENAPDDRGWGRSESIPGKAFIIKGIDDNIVLGTSSVVSHEMGHCLGLFHTFRGNDAKTTFPADTVWTNPCTGETFTVPYCRELVSGSNSGSCGDFIHDTPADWGFGESQVNSNCDYIGNRTEVVTGLPYAPDSRDIMSYSRVDCLEHFTAEQGEVMLSTIENSAILSSVYNNIILANRVEGSDSLLGGTLYLDDLATSGTIDNEHVPSGSIIDYYPEDYYNVGTEQEFISALKHIDWDGDRENYLLNIDNFQIPLESEITANFTDKINVTFQSPIGFDIYDPWYVDNQTTLHQPDNFITITGGVYPMFIQQGGSPPNLQFPYYTLRAPGEYITQGNDHYYFQGWRVVPSDAAMFTNANALETPVVFTGGDCTIYLDYLNTNAFSGNVWTDQTFSEDLNVTGNVTIQPGANVTLTSGITVRMHPSKKAHRYLVWVEVADR